MNQRLRTVCNILVEMRSIILLLAVINFILVWIVARERGSWGITCAACPWYFPWYWDNQPTQLLIAAIVLRVNRVIGSLVALLISGYLLWSIGSYFVVQPDSFHYEWLWVRRVATEPFEVVSGHVQYLFALFIFCSSTLYLTKTVLGANPLRRTADNTRLERTRR
jgi:hypothetical protein